MTTPTIANLEARVSSLQDDLRQAQDELRQARLAAAPFKIGEVVWAEREVRAKPGEYRRGPAPKVWEPAIVRDVTNLWSETPSYRVSFRRKDGTWAGKASYLYGGIRRAQP